MLTIELTNKEAYGESGPNFIWVGPQKNFAQLIDKLKQLSSQDDLEFHIINNDDYQLIGCNKVLLISKNGTNKLVNITNDIVKCELPKELWNRILDLLTPLTQSNGFQYIELDNVDSLIEEANWIIEST